MGVSQSQTGKIGRIERVDSLSLFVKNNGFIELTLGCIKLPKPTCRYIKISVQT